jgi:hypothetical protein
MILCRCAVLAANLGQETCQYLDNMSAHGMNVLYTLLHCLLSPPPLTSWVKSNCLKTCNLSNGVSRAAVHLRPVTASCTAPAAACFKTPPAPSAVATKGTWQLCRTQSQPLHAMGMMQTCGCELILSSHTASLHVHTSCAQGASTSMPREESAHPLPSLACRGRVRLLACFAC